MAITKVPSGMLDSDSIAESILVDTKDDIALLGFKVAANGSLAAYNLSKQTVDDFVDSSGVDTSASSDARRMSGNYYKGAVSGNATGGTITSYSSGGTTYKVHTLANGDNFVTPATGTVDFLIVGGGGGGWYGGGGAGGVVYGSNQTLTASTYPVVVGAGAAQRNNGSDSSFNSFTAKGGGAGGNYTSGSTTAANGGNGGGGGNGNPIGGIGGSSTQDTYSGTSNVTGYGTSNTSYRGGGYAAPNDDGAQGGAGAGAAGVWVPASHTSGYYNWPNYGAGGAGGDGLQFDITGTNLYYAGGGGGAMGDLTPGGSGGQGGGGNGGATGSDNGSDGTDGLGGGGGGGKTSIGGSGGDGTVIVRYIENDFVTSEQANMTLISNASTADSAPDKADIVMTYTDGIGTATINTDIKAYVSRDGGTTWTQATLSATGTSGGHSILTAHNIDISSQPSGTSMKYKIETLNQSASKETRIQGVSLGWK